MLIFASFKVSKEGEREAESDEKIMHLQLCLLCICYVIHRDSKEYQLDTFEKIHFYLQIRTEDLTYNKSVSPVCTHTLTGSSVRSDTDLNEMTD